MKSIRMLGLTVAAVLALTAVASASSAVAATALCKENTTTCKLSSMYQGGTTVEAKLKSGTTLSLTTNGGLITHQTCTGSTLTGKTIHKEGSGLPIEFTGLTFSGCSGSCEKATAANLPYSGELSSTTGGNGTLTVGTGIKLTGCPIGTSCTFAGTINLAFEGGSPALIVAKEATLPRESGAAASLCGEFAKLSATYELSKPSPAFASTSEGSREIKKTELCREGTEPCAEAQSYTVGEFIEAESKSLTFTFNGLGGTLATCGGSAIKAELLAKKGEPSLPLAMKSFSIESCTTPGCAYSTSIGPNGSVRAVGDGNGILTTPLTFTFKNCTVNHYECVYSGEVQLELRGDSTAELIAQEVAMKRVSKENVFCGTEGHLTATYTFTGPKNIWVTEAWK